MADIKIIRLNTPVEDLLHKFLKEEYGTWFPVKRDKGYYLLLDRNAQAALHPPPFNLKPLLNPHSSPIADASALILNGLIEYFTSPQRRDYYRVK